MEASYSKVDVRELVNTGMFKLDVAQSGYGWLQDLHAMTVREVRHGFYLSSVTHGLPRCSTRV